MVGDQPRGIAERDERGRFLTGDRRGGRDELKRREEGGGDATRQPTLILGGFWESSFFSFPFSAGASTGGKPLSRRQIS